MEDKTGTIRHNLIAGLDPDGNVRAVKVNEDGELSGGGGGGAIDTTNLATKAKQDEHKELIEGIFQVLINDDNSPVLNKLSLLESLVYILGLPGAEAPDSINKKIDSLLPANSATGATNFAVSSTVQTIPTKSDRKGLTIFNPLGFDIYVNLGVDVSSTIYTVALTQDFRYYEVPYGYLGSISLIANSGNTGNIFINEFT
jgi:hypothetical protein